MVIIFIIFFNIFICSNCCAQDLLKSKDCKIFGHWELTAKGLEHTPIGSQDKTGGLYCLSPLPENFTIDFEWIEKSKNKDTEPPGGLSFNYGGFGQFGESLDCYFSGYLIKLHTENPTKDKKIGNLNGETSSSVILNFLKPPGNPNKGRIICHDQKIQILINDNLVFDLDLSDIFKAKMDGVDLSQDFLNGLKNWSDAKKKGLYTSITRAASPKNSDFAVVKKFVISDNKKYQMAKALVDPINDKEALWCKSGDLDPEKLKFYSEISLFLQKVGFRNGISRETDLFEPFSGFKNPLISNNQLLAKEYTRGLFGQGVRGGLKVETYFVANIKDSCNSSIKVFQFGSQDDSKEAINICKKAFGKEDGKLLTYKINGNYLLLCVMHEDGQRLDANEYYKDINAFFLGLKP